MEFVAVEEDNHASVMVVEQDRDDNNGPAVYRPVELDTLPPGQRTRVTVPRLHFSKATEDTKKHLHLLVRLLAVDHDGISHPIQTFVSSRFIVK